MKTLFSRATLAHQLLTELSQRQHAVDSQESEHQNQRQIISNEIARQARHVISQSESAQLSDWLTRMGFSVIDAKLLDATVAKGASQKHIGDLINQDPQLRRYLIDWMNSPYYQPKRRSGQIISIDDAKVALGFMGEENSWRVMPLLVLQKALPYANDPYKPISQYYWELGLAAGLSGETIANSTDDKKQAFTTAIFHIIIESLAVKYYFYVYERLKLQSVSSVNDSLKHCSPLLRCFPTVEHVVGNLDSLYPMFETLMPQLIPCQRLPTALVPTGVKTTRKQQLILRTVKTAIQYGHWRVMKRHCDTSGITGDMVEKLFPSNSSCYQQLNNQSLMRLPWHHQGQVSPNLA